MAEYLYEARDLRTGERLGALPLAGVTYSHDVETFGELTARVDLARRTRSGRRLAADYIAATTPRRSVVWVLRDGQLMEGYIVWGRRTSVEEGGRWLHLRAYSLWSYFHRRVLTVTKNYHGWDQLAIARDLVTWAQQQPGGNIRVGTVAQASGVVRDFGPLAYGYERRFVGQLVEQVAAMERGFEHSIDVALVNDEPVATFRCHYPRRGRRAKASGITFTRGVRRGNLLAYEYDEDGLDAVTTVHAVGAGEGTDMALSTRSEMALIDQGYPLQEDVVGFKDVSSPTNLGALAAGELRRRARTHATWALTVHPDDRSAPFGAWVVGDDVRIIIEDDERFPAGEQGEPGYDGVARILRQTVTVHDDGGPDRVRLELGAAFDG